MRIRRCIEQRFEGPQVLVLKSSCCKSPSVGVSSPTYSRVGNPEVYGRLTGGDPCNCALVRVAVRGLCVTSYQRAKDRVAPCHGC